MQLLGGKVAVVTGGGNGLGRCHALALAAAGARVVVNDLGGHVTGGGAGDAADAVAEEIRDLGGQAVANRASVADWAGAATIIEQAVATFGGLDIVVNNAGINRPASIAAMTEADFDLEVGVHLKGTAAVSHHAARFWADRGPAAGRAIINTTSPVGVHPMPDGGPYCAAKAGIAAFTQVLAQELAGLGVRANAIAPAARTRMVMAFPSVDQLMPRATGFDRHAPEHVSPLVVYLASSLCRFTGRVFGVEGPDVTLYTPWSADLLVTADGGWDLDALAAALADAPPQAAIRAFYPGGRIDTVSPPNRTLKALAAAELLG
ncbi:SDR family NAD(P)-dependent oxidoreductase [Polymorphobacter fuscus]|uniref:SDR family NAD(P)-dependent oxidoreductase n=1 Tax=Sandarakinorhabdus fusca TaxID=1439888 RepID=A0A7C9KVE9_9SPHN|nr:SDR family NAD(P)-dependent oxidoreductase [Polymorphobacter fuscus]KAB7648632.1 SDR family NAD(P)-dependent oxidoreductase [Polymorphobacter fuscus]MQT16185.1 SDR family NAD(P)-dependent oxidoreductase [Polymorphobacter fuscus]NJC07532.1 NAD(P)-dependent dehydrogenase (short-subunit alcohol dehydrogenase family) [Polymorphobacter fuscus]